MSDEVGEVAVARVARLQFVETQLAEKASDAAVGDGAIRRDAVEAFDEEHILPHHTPEQHRRDMDARTRGEPHDGVPGLDEVVGVGRGVELNRARRPPATDADIR